MKETRAARLKRRRQWLRWYRQTAKGKAATRRSNQEYHQSEKGKVANARYAASAKGKATRARYLASPKRQAVVARYRASPKGKAAVRRSSEKYRQSAKGKAALRRQYAKQVWQALADRYGTGTLGQIRRTIQRHLTKVGPDRLSLQRQLRRDQNRCQRAIAAIGAQYPRTSSRAVRRPG